MITTPRLACLAAPLMVAALASATQASAPARTEMDDAGTSNHSALVKKLNDHNTVKGTD